MTLRFRQPAALRHRNFRLFFGGQFVSLIGTWMQTAAQNWLVYTLTGSAEKLGELNLVGAIPGMLVTVWGGVIADRYSKRAILLVTQSAFMLLAFVLFFLVYRGIVQYEQILLVAFLLGFVNAVDMPTRGAFVIELVGREDVASAVALNSSIFNASRIVGPAVAGLIVAGSGTATCFLVNGVSFLAPIAGLMLLSLPPHERPCGQPSPVGQLRAAGSFIYQHRAVRNLVLLLAATSLLLWGSSVLLPVYAGELLAAGPREYGLLLSASGVGAVIGALLLSMAPDHPAPARLYRTRVVSGILVFCAAGLVFAWSRSMPLSLLCQVVAGWASIAYFSTSNTWLQVLVPDDMRGRVFGFYHTMFQGLAPVGSFLTAWIAQRHGAPIALTIVTTGCAALVLMAALRERLNFTRPRGDGA